METHENSFSVIGDRSNSLNAGDRYEWEERKALETLQAICCLFAPDWVINYSSKTLNI